MRVLLGIAAPTLFILASCVSVGETDTDASCVADIKSRTVSFVKDVAPVLQKACISCHSSMADAGSYRSGYYPNSGANSALSRVKLPASDSKHMPTSSTLSECKVLIIQKWEADGYAN